MRQMLLSFFIFLLPAAPLNAQHANFLLHVGNVWQYSMLVDPSQGIDGHQEIPVVGDSIMPNDHHYRNQRTL